MNRLAFLLVMISTVAVAQRGYKDSNRIGIGAGLTQMNIYTSNFEITPESGAKSPAKIFSIVDFPAPFFPTSPTRSPAPKRNVTSSKRKVPPKETDKLCILSMINF